MLKQKLQYFGHLMQRVDSLEKPLMLGKSEGGRRSGDRGWDGWMASPTQWTWVWATPGDSEGEGSRMCCNPWGRKELDMTCDWTRRTRWLSGKESACRWRRCRRTCVGKTPWGRKWQPTPVFLPGKFHEHRSLVGYSPGVYRVGHSWVTELTNTRAVLQDGSLNNSTCIPTWHKWVETKPTHVLQWLRLKNCSSYNPVTSKQTTQSKNRQKT